MADWHSSKSGRQSAYSEKLKDPRWQKMRLEVLQRDEWACRKCQSREDTLHVHHLYYERGRDPWDYPTEALMTLCEGCHAFETEWRPGAEEALISSLRAHGYLADELVAIGEALFEASEIARPWTIASLIFVMLKDKAFVERFALAVDSEEDEAHRRFGGGADQ